ncbi:hypothetical protein Nmel_010420 [Mimus melanotis]
MDPLHRGPALGGSRRARLRTTPAVPGSLRRAQRPPGSACGAPRAVRGGGGCAGPGPAMAGRRCAGGAAALAEAPGCGAAAAEPARELFEACRNGDVERVKRLVRPENVNSRDTAGRKSSPLHFAAETKPHLALRTHLE